MFKGLFHFLEANTMALKLKKVPIRATYLDILSTWELFLRAAEV
jgi:hypothetical protein